MPHFELRVPDGDERERRICATCGFIDYENPKIVVGSVVSNRGRVLMCRRAIEPRRGFWTLPAGFLEMGETPSEGARREALEEAQALIELDGILGIYSISRISQVQIIFRARFADEAAARFGAGPESQDVALFTWDALPWDDIAFPSVTWSLQAWHARPEGPLGAPQTGPLQSGAFP